MTGDVLEYGDAKPPRRWPRPLLAVTVVAALAASGVTYATTRRTHPRAGWTEYPTQSGSPTPSPDGSDLDEFAGAMTVPEPPDGSVTGWLLPDGTPLFVAEDHGIVHVVDAWAGPEHAPVLLGWCAPLKRFEDASATYVVTSYLRLRAHQTRHVARGVAIAEGAEVPPPDQAIEPSPHPHCPKPVTYPPLPTRATTVHSNDDQYHLITGRYLVTHETRAFCAAVKPSGCADQGWETYGQMTLPPGDLAGSYTWEGDFLVRADPRDGFLTVVLMQGVRLVSRQQVGVRVELGLAKRTYRKAGVLHLVIENGYDFPVREDAGIVLGRGITGLGRPKATTATLDHFVSLYANRFNVYVVLDAHERAVRVVCPDETDGSFVSDFMPPPP